MNTSLDLRYSALFSSYGAGASYAVVTAKELISSWMDENPGLLRTDGAYFLLVNFDHMIVRPHMGYVPSVGFNIGQWASAELSTTEPVSGGSLGNVAVAAALPSDYHAVMHAFMQSEELFISNVEQALSIILSALQGEVEPASAHKVMLVIDENWAQLQVLFGWA